MVGLSKLETVRAGSICNGLRQIIFSDYGRFSKMTPTHVKYHQTKTKNVVSIARIQKFIKLMEEKRSAKRKSNFLCCLFSVQKVTQDFLSSVVCPDSF